MNQELEKLFLSKDFLAMELLCKFPFKLKDEEIKSVYHTMERCKIVFLHKDNIHVFMDSLYDINKNLYFFIKTYPIGKLFSIKTVNELQNWEKEINDEYFNNVLSINNNDLKYDEFIVHQILLTIGELKLNGFGEGDDLTINIAGLLFKN